MDIKLILPLVLLTMAGMFLLGSGITGFIISESCCLGDGCSPENMCDVANPHLEMPSPSENMNAYFGRRRRFLSR